MSTITTSNNEPRWYVIYTKARAEKKVAKQLSLMEIQCYCPVRQEVRQWSDRKKKIDVPILPSMVLVKLPQNERNRVFECPNTIRYLFWDGKPAIVKEEEISVLRESLESGAVLSHEVSELRPGSKVNMSEFGFEAEEGTVKYASDNHCWIIMKNLGMVVKLKIGK